MSSPYSLQCMRSIFNSSSYHAHALYAALSLQLMRTISHLPVQCPSPILASSSFNMVPIHHTIYHVVYDPHMCGRCTSTISYIIIMVSSPCTPSSILCTRTMLLSVHAHHIPYSHTVSQPHTRSLLSRHGAYTAHDICMWFTISIFVDGA